MAVSMTQQNDYPQNKDLLTPEDIALALRLDLEKVKRLLRLGDIPSIKIGKERRVYVTDFEAYVQSIKQEGRKEK